MTMHQDYSGAFCALACLRSALASMALAAKRGQTSRVGDFAREAAYWADELGKRRESARKARRKAQ